MESSEKCQNCGRNLEEGELYCYFCDMDLSESGKKPKNKEEKGQNKH